MRTHGLARIGHSKNYKALVQKRKINSLSKKNHAIPSDFPIRFISSRFVVVSLISGFLSRSHITFVDSPEDVGRNCGIKKATEKNKILCVHYK